MAVVNLFFKDPRNSRPHPTFVECGWSVINAGKQHLLQLSTFGSDTRQSEKKVSQTIQIDEAAAEELVKIIKAAFPRIRA
ncbi:hypothetical protein E0H75_35140 [Kribbella capetownensis]|uniref:Uncharacterized protein n=1 Tax=Kribbella capetownensis TaxID=1572659 RepID=A0A4R0JHK4_9ACTN|nr:hypothetical protein E0H75_35140 [Kribbella capetownensis]